MANVKTLKGGKFQFKKKDGTWSKTKYGTKSAALSARRGTRGSGGVSKSGGGDTTPKKKGWGAWAKVGRTIDVVTGPAQGAAMQSGGLNMDAATRTARRYTGELSAGGPFNIDVAKGTYGGIATGLGRNWLRSKMGVYRGIGQKKLISFLMAGNPEVLAYGETDPTEDLATWNQARMLYDRGYSAVDNGWTLRDSRFLRSFGLDLVLKGGQMLAEKFVNPELPPGWNL